MNRKLLRRAGGVAAAGAVGASLLVLPASAGAPGTTAGPSTSIDPYVVPVASGTSITSLVTVNDPSAGATNGYDLVGIPDGMGAFERATDGRILVNVNHELRPDRGVVRRHGQKGSFVSRWVLDPTTFEVVAGGDLTWKVAYFDSITKTFTATPTDGQPLALARLCSGTTAAEGQLYNPSTGRGTPLPLHFAGEETGAEGRAFVTMPNGVTRAVPRLGRFSFENAVPARNATDRTVVATSDDQFNGRIGIYTGTKQRIGGAIAKAGLDNGALANVKLDDVAVQTDAQFRAAYDKGDVVGFGLVDVNWDQTGVAQKAESEGKGAFLMNRVEDLAWDPANPNDLYVLTTDGGEGTGEGGGGGLWRLSFVDVENPAAGGTIELLLDGTETPTLDKPDNMDIDALGNILIQEDPGAADVVAEITAYRISDGASGVVAKFDPARFDPAVAGPALMTNDEESSGIIDVAHLLGPGWFLFDAQAHTSAGLPAGTGRGTVEELQENGQLLAMHVTDWTAVYGS
jgi:hypothetical protein